MENNENVQNIVNTAFEAPVAMVALPLVTFMFFFGTPLVFASMGASMMD